MRTNTYMAELTSKENILLDRVLATIGEVLFGPDSYTDFELYADLVDGYVAREKEAYLTDFDAFISRLGMDLAVVHHAGEYRTKVILGERELAEKQASKRKAESDAQENHSHPLSGGHVNYDDCPPPDRMSCSTAAITIN